MTSRVDPGSIRSRLARAFRGTLVWYGFLALPLFLIMVFVAYPTALAFRDSVFTETPQGPQFAGLYHFGRLFSSSIFWGALGNTVLLGVAFLGITIPLATILASMLNRHFQGNLTQSCLSGIGPNSRPPPAIGLPYECTGYRIISCTQNDRGPHDGRRGAQDRTGACGGATRPRGGAPDARRP